MDYSTLSDADKAKYGQYYQQYHHQPYDPAQSQAYYYANHNPPPPPTHYAAEAGAYHQPAIHHSAAAVEYHQPLLHYAAESAAYHQPAPHYAAAAAYHQPPPHYAADAYYQHPPPDPVAIHADPAARLAREMNPAAAAAVSALSQLTEYAENMSAAERAKPLMQYGSAPIWPVGGGRRGGAPFRGGGRGGRVSFNAGASPPLRGRGRGRSAMGGGRQSQPSDPAMGLSKAPLVTPIWCEVCRVECNNLFILEQHKSGKRHKKTVNQLEVMQAQKRLHSTEESIPDSSTGEAKGPPTAPETIKERSSGFKRKMTSFARGGKRLRPIEQPKENKSRFCSICNVTCDTQAVFEIHLSGKKHILKMQQLQGQGAAYGHERINQSNERIIGKGQDLSANLTITPAAAQVPLSRNPHYISNMVRLGPER